MINLDSITNENNKKHNKKWPYIPDHPYRILIIGGSGSGKTNTLLNLINEQNDIDKIYLYARDLNEPKYKILIKKRKDAGIKHLNDPNAFIECSNTMDDVYENIHDYNSSRKRKILIIFGEMITDIVTNEKFQATIKQLFIDLFEKRVFSYKGKISKTKEINKSAGQLDENNFFRDIENESEGINYELFEKSFKISVPTVLAKTLSETNNKKKNITLVNVTKH